MNQRENEIPNSAPISLPAKRKRTASSSHLTCAGAFPCEQAVPLRTFRFDPTASGPAGQQASLERQGWVGTSREIVALLCAFEDCSAFIMLFVAASAALGAETYQRRLCAHQFACNRACATKWMRHCGTGSTATNKQRLSRCAHVRDVRQIDAPEVSAPASLASVQQLQPARKNVTAEKFQAARQRILSQPEPVTDSDSESASETELETDSNADIDVDFDESDVDEIIDEPPAVVKQNLAQQARNPPVKVDPATVVVTVSLPEGVTLEQLSTAAPELLESADTTELWELMRAQFMPSNRDFGELLPFEAGKGIARLRDEVVLCMAEHVAHHRLLVGHDSDCGGRTYEVQSQYRLCGASKDELQRLVEKMCDHSPWFKAMRELTERKPVVGMRWGKKTLLGTYDKRERIWAFLRALVQVLFPKFVQSPMFRVEDYDKDPWNHGWSTWDAFWH